MLYCLFEKLAKCTTNWAGSTKGFVLALIAIFLWTVMGPVFDYSDTWQLVINTGTTIVTFLMVFLLQRAHNKESIAIQMKLNELIASKEGASNKLINIEDLTEDQIAEIQIRFQKLAKLVESDDDPLKTRTIEEV